MTNPKSSRLILLLLVVTFILPMLLASYCYQRDQGTSTKTINRGILLQPPFMNAMHLPLNIHWPQRQWWLVYVSAKPCDVACQKDLYKMRQIWVALNKDQPRVQRVWLTLENQHTPMLDPKLRQGFGNMLVMAITHQDWADFWRFVARENGKLSFIYQGNGFFIVDPMGNLVLAYPADTVPRDIYKDLTHLLKVSGIG